MLKKLYVNDSTYHDLPFFLFEFVYTTLQCVNLR